MGLNIEHVLKFSTEQGYIDQLAINCVTYCHSGYTAAKSGLRHLHCLAWVLLQEIGCHTGACGAANCPKTAWKRGASCRICALFLQTSLLLFRRSIKVFPLKNLMDFGHRLQVPRRRVAASFWWLSGECYLLDPPCPLPLPSVPLILGSLRRIASSLCSATIMPAHI